jgi:hypothetical protein
MNEAQMPFFARFLEGQEYPQVESDVKAGPGGWGGGTAPAIDQVHTMKYPSDGDDNPPSI